MPVKYGIIGVGAIAQRRHIPECIANPDSVLLGIADANQSRCDELGAKFGVKSFCDHKDLLKMGEIDAVIVSGPNALHASQTIDALNAGKPEIKAKGLDRTGGDKPLTYTAPDLGSDSPSVQTSGGDQAAGAKSATAKRQQARSNPNRGSRGNKGGATNRSKRKR